MIRNTIIQIGKSELSVEYIYYPTERQTWDYPGYPEHIEIHTICYNKRELNVTDKLYDIVEKLIFNQMRNDDKLFNESRY